MSGLPTNGDGLRSPEPPSPQSIERLAREARGLLYTIRTAMPFVPRIPFGAEYVVRFAELGEGVRHLLSELPGELSTSCRSPEAELLLAERVARLAHLIVTARELGRDVVWAYDGACRCCGVRDGHHERGCVVARTQEHCGVSGLERSGAAT